MAKQGKFLGIPYDWRGLTLQRLKSRWWNKDVSHLFTPKAIGWGYDINLYDLIYRKTILFISIIVILALLVFFAIQQAIYADHAHATFENYYAFRGCTELITRTDSYGICKTNTGNTIKIVEFQGKWYLDGDLPTCWHNICF